MEGESSLANRRKQRSPKSYSVPVTASTVLTVVIVGLVLILISRWIGIQEGERATRENNSVAVMQQTPEGARLGVFGIDPQEVGCPPPLQPQEPDFRLRDLIGGSYQCLGTITPQDLIEWIPGGARFFMRMQPAINLGREAILYYAIGNTKEDGMHKIVVPGWGTICLEKTTFPGDQIPKGIIRTTIYLIGEGGITPETEIDCGDAPLSERF